MGAEFSALFVKRCLVALSGLCRPVWISRMTKPAEDRVTGEFIPAGRPTRTSGSTTAPSPITTRRSGSTPSTPSLTTAAAPPISARASTTAPSRITTRRSGSTPSSPLLTTTAASPTKTSGSTTAPSPITTRRSGSIPSAPSLTTAAATPTKARASTTAPSPIMTKPSARIPIMPMPTRTGEMLISRGAMPHGHRRISRPPLGSIPHSAEGTVPGRGSGTADHPAAGGAPASSRETPSGWNGAHDYQARSSNFGLTEIIPRQRPRV